MSDSTPNKPVRQAIVDNFIEQLKNGTSPITRPASAGEILPPINAVTGKAYSSANRLVLTEAGDDPRWLTKRQAEGLGYQLKDSAQPRRLIFWEYTKEVPAHNPDGSPRLNNIGQPVMETVRRDRPLMREYTVHHARDFVTAEGQDLPPYEAPAPDIDPLDRATAILANSGAAIRHDPNPNAAIYKSRADLIVLPEKSLVSEEEYCAQAIKELAAWTGHPDRLGWREGVAGGERQLQADLQELMAGAMIAQDLGLKFEPEADQRIIGHWVKALENDPDMFFRAATQADNIRLYVMCLERTQGREAGDGNRERPEYSSQGFRPAGPEDKPELGAWIRAADDSEATVFAVLSGRDGSIVCTFDSREGSDIEAKALNMGVAPAPKYSGEPVLLDVTFEEKEMVKALGATWDRKNNSWCARPGVELTRLGRWLPANELRRDDLVEPDLQDRLALDVPYTRRQEAKDLGAFFDNQKGAWVTSANNKNLDELTKKFPPRPGLEAAPEQAAAMTAEAAAVPEIATERVVLAVPFEEKNLAKAAGAKWDRDEKVWVAEPGTDLAKLSNWIPEKEPEPEQVLAAAEEFSKTLKEAGFQLDGLPKMDGKIYRVPLQDGKPNSKDGAYYAAMNGDRPNGWLKNHQSGEHKVWIYSGQEMTPDGLATQKEQALSKRQAREDKAESLSMAVWEAGRHDMDGVRHDDDGNLMVPGVNIDGRLQTVQTIKPDGEMRFEKDGNRVGAMCVIDSAKVISETDLKTGLPAFRPEYTGDESLNNDILIAEDYHTGASLHLATGLPVAVAFSPDNLVKVASSLRDKYPQSNLLVCANNHPERAYNLSLKKAGEAARKAHGKLVTPTLFEQGAGLKSFSDMHKTHGLEAVTSAITQVRRQEQVQNAGLGR